MAAPTPAPQEGPRIAVIDAAPLGVDPSAATYVTNVLRMAIAEQHFAVVPTPELHEAARRIRLPFPVPVEGMFELNRALQTPVSATAEVRAAQGLYVVRLRVRVAVESQERVREVSATQFLLADAIRAALPALLVPPSPDARPPSPPDSVLAPTPTPAPVTVETPRRPRRLRAHPRRWELGAGPIVSFGPGRDAFVNALVATRLSFFPADRVGLSATLGYANLNGRDGRVSNIYLSAGVETAVDLSSTSKLFIPLRAEIGYLPNNGPVFRITAGLSIQLARRVRLELDILSPSLWVLPETTPVSLDLGARVNFGL